ncbi:uncharacterized protein [Amphiura filiformis]|uniref:uncharacterized protein isoform X1 n=1 Tax=Amphiura filiformis TaxID=82378 RepID=UPI003B221571
MILKTDFISWSIGVSSLLLSSVFLLVGSPTNVAAREHRLIRQAQKLPIEPTTPSTECRNSVYSIGRSLQYHYICCEETRQVGQPRQGGEGQKKKVPNLDCNPVNAFGTLNEIFFNCNGTEGQNNARHSCDRRWGFVAEDTCWMWSTCYTGACQKEELNLGSAVKEGFCGDGRCDHKENVEECAIDCCPEVNFECSVTNSTCADICCSEPSCCMNLSFLVGNQWRYILIGVGVCIVLVSICCCVCCCCFCC